VFCLTHPDAVMALLGAAERLLALTRGDTLIAEQAEALTRRGLHLAAQITINCRAFLCTYLHIRTVLLAAS
jgi:hypothetical protein